MIRRINIGLQSGDSGLPRSGSCVIFTDGAETVVIDGYCSTVKTRMIKYLKSHGIKSPWLYLTHPHGDHDDGIEDIIDDSWFSPKGFRCYDPDSIKEGANQNSPINSDRNRLIRIINKCKSKGIPVKCVHSSDSYTHGEIKFKVYREQPHFEGNDEDPQGWSYLNDGSLIFWFYELGTLVCGDGPMAVGEFCQKRNIHAKDFQIPHHGGNCNRGRANLMRQLGAIYCWDDNWVASDDEFVQYGRKRCIEAGIKYIDIRGDINVIYFRKKAVIYKHGNVYRYTCSYNGVPTLKDHNSNVVRLVLRGKYKSDDARTTMLLDDGYNPVLVQKSVNEVIRIAKGIKNGTLNYGKNDARIKKIDAELGTGYGQLVQDYINVLFGVKESV